MSTFFSLRGAPTMVKEVYYWFTAGFRSLLGLCIVTGLLFVVVEPASAQLYEEEQSPRGSERIQDPSDGRDGGSSPSSLPEWAAPSQSSDDGSSSLGGAETQAPPPPDNPDQVPVDGGLALLAAAGAGYAVRKLSEEEEEEDSLA